MVGSNYLCRYRDALAVIPYLEGPLISAGIVNNGWVKREVPQGKKCVVQTITSRSLTLALKNSIVSTWFSQSGKQQEKSCLAEMLSFMLVLQCKGSQHQKGKVCMPNDWGMTDEWEWWPRLQIPLSTLECLSPWRLFETQHQSFFLTLSSWHCD